MTNSPADLFQAYQAGDDEAMASLISQEQLRLFDYLFRMTGDKARSADAADEAAQAVQARGNKFTSVGDVRVSLYSTARNFSADTWNADTSQLLNDALAPFVPKSNQKADDKKKGIPPPVPTVIEPHFDKLDEAIRTLPGQQREVAILVLKVGMSPQECAQVMGWPEDKVVVTGQEVLAQIEKELGEPDLDVAQEIMMMPLHPYPVRTNSSTMALSEVIENVRRSRPAILTHMLQLIIVFALLGILIVIAYVVNPEIFRK